MPIEIEGVAELSELLEREAPAAAKRYLLKVAAPAADVVVQAAKETAPVRYGVLQAGIRRWTHWSGDSNGTQLEIDIGPTKQQFWGLFQEEGTKEKTGIVKRGKRKGQRFRHPATPARHWYLRAWEGCKDRVLEKFVEGAREMIERLRARHA